MTQPIKLIAFDLDGTVLKPDLSISPRVHDAIERAKQRGIYVTIATGRSVHTTQIFAERVGVTAPIVSMQGGVVYDYETQRELVHLRMPRALACELVSLADEHPSWHPVLYHNEYIYISEYKLTREFYLSHLISTEPIVAPDLCGSIHSADEEPDKVLFVVAPPESAHALATVTQRVGNRGIVVQSHKMFVEVNPLNAHKGAGLAAIAAHLGVPRESVLAIGDQNNDLTMIQWAGVGVAMGNGIPELKAIADWVAPSIDEDGVAAAIERFALS